jgi:hypothetical protein
MSVGSNTVVENSPHHLKVKGSSPVAAIKNAREKVSVTDYFCSGRKLRPYIGSDMGSTFFGVMILDVSGK